MTIEVTRFSFLTHATARLEGVCSCEDASLLVLTFDAGKVKLDMIETPSGAKSFCCDIFFDHETVQKGDNTLELKAYSGTKCLTTLRVTYDLASLRRTRDNDDDPRRPVGLLSSRFSWPDNLESGLTTVILGIYNGEPYLHHAIESVLGQTDRHFQFIIVDDASTDNTRKILEDYAARDARIELILKNNNKGQGAAFNSGIECARGDLTCFMDADDYWFADKLESVRRHFEEDPKANTYSIYQHRLNICAGDVLTQDPFRPSLYEGDILNFCLRERIPIVGPFSPTSGLAFPTEVLRCSYPIPPEFRICADGFLTRAATILGHSRAISRALGAYRIHDTNNTADNEGFDQQEYIHYMLKPAVNRLYLQNNIQAHLPIIHRANKNIPLNRMTRYRNKRSVFYMPSVKPIINGVEDFKDIHKGKRAFIVATGPSLQTPDLDFLKDEITFSCNKITLAFNETDWQPTYYSIIDSMVYESFDFEWSRLKSIKFFPDDLKGKYASMQDAFFLRNRTPVYNDGERILEFSKDISENVAGGFTVVYFLMQLAYYMGIKELYLIGLDFNFSYNTVSDEKSSKGETIIINEGEVNHFHKGYRPDGQRWTMPRLDLQEKAFQEAKRVFEADGRKILNASRQTKLNLFERVNFEDLFETPRHEPSHDLYGDVVYAGFNKTTCRLDVCGWVSPEPSVIEIFHKGQVVSKAQITKSGISNAAIISTAGIWIWEVDNVVVPMNPGDHIRIVLTFPDGACTALACEIQAYSHNWQWQEMREQVRANNGVSLEFNSMFPSGL